MTIIKIGREEPFAGLASIDNIRTTVPEALRDAAIEASTLLRIAGIRHVLVGGVAVSCNGYGRTTQNVDVVVEEKAFEHRDKALFLRIGLPFKISGIPIHYVVPTNPFEIAMLEQYLEIPASGHVPVLQIGPLTVMKLISRRHKDLADLIELFKRRTPDLDAIRIFVKENLPSRVPLLDELITCAEDESAQGPAE
jgi:hypothetical protein